MPYKILVADDDLDNRTIAQVALERAGYDVIIATDGDEALGRIIAEKPDVVLLDLSMPRLDGWEVAGRVRADKTVAHIPIIAFTAHGLAGDELKAKAAGCDDYVSKPCPPKIMVERITYWAGRARLPSEAA